MRFEQIGESLPHVGDLLLPIGKVGVCEEFGKQSERQRPNRPVRLTGDQLGDIVGNDVPNPKARASQRFGERTDRDALTVP